eukprot:TRINITY_DN1134_c0_g1_i1.p1 TRINITY_DN1134_c0_g1~~TRINITY_DN1134_c0_g1_i1.p1  ORF type:complete len:149 (-),score=33.29 TRINITY_DN1134_c0_g1_i1:370-816(-)
MSYDIMKLEQTVQEKKQFMKGVKSECKDIETKIQQLEEEKQGLMITDESLSKEVQLARAKLDELKSSIDLSHSESKVLSKLMSLMSKGQLPGIYGRLGNLGTIADMDKYDVAITTVCARLDNIVVIPQPQQHAVWRYCVNRTQEGNSP